MTEDSEPRVRVEIRRQWESELLADAVSFGLAADVVAMSIERLGTQLTPDQLLAMCATAVDLALQLIMGDSDLGRRWYDAHVAQAAAEHGTTRAQERESHRQFADACRAFHPDWRKS